MKFSPKRRVFVHLIFALLVSLNVLGQEPPKPELVDEFGELPCEDLLGRTDALAAQLDREPGTRAAILIRPTKVNIKGVHRRLMIASTLRLRGVPDDRFAIYQGTPTAHGQIETQYWKLQTDATATFEGATLWAEEKPDVSSPFIFGYEDEIGICPTFVPKNFAKLILSNPGSRGHIVVRSGADSGYVNRFFFANQWTKELVEKQGIPRTRLRLFFAKGTALTEAEFWFVPDRKK
jgi:hypothetical protein